MNNLGEVNNYPVAWKPNNLRLKMGNGSGPIEYLIFTSFFTVQMEFDSDNDVILRVDIDLITKKKLKGSFCNRIKTACENVSKWQLEIPGNGRTRYDFINIFISITRRENKIIAVISKKVAPYIKDYFTKGFTKIPMIEARNLKTLYQLQLLELCLRFKNCKKPVFDIEWIKSHLNIPKNKYKRYPHLKKRVFSSSFNGINTNTSFNFNFEEIKKGNKVVALKLVPIRNKKDLMDSIEDQHDKEFDFALTCFNLLPIEDKKQYYEGLFDSLGSEMALYAATDKFLNENDSLLKTSKTSNDFIKAFNIKKNE